MIKYIIIAIIGVLFVVVMLPKYTKIKGHSMYPTLLNGKAYRVIPKPFVRNFKRGDIAVVYVQGWHGYVKRIIAVGGDKLRVTRKGGVYINDELLDEPYILPKMRGGKDVNIVVPDGCYFVMGDNRRQSTDSRHFGMLERWQILGKIILKKEKR